MLCLLYQQLDNFVLDKKTILTKVGGEYQLNRVVSQGEKIDRTSNTFPEEAMRGFISEGSNLLLSRLLIKKGLPSSFQAISFDSDGNLCKSPYVSTDILSRKSNITRITLAKQKISRLTLIADCSGIEESVSG